MQRFEIQGPFLEVAADSAGPSVPVGSEEGVDLEVRLFDNDFLRENLSEAQRLLCEYWADELERSLSDLGNLAGADLDIDLGRLYSDSYHTAMARRHLAKLDHQVNQAGATMLKDYEFRSRRKIVRDYSELGKKGTNMDFFEQLTSRVVDSSVNLHLFSESEGGYLNPDELSRLITETGGIPMVPKSQSVTAW